MGTCSPIPLDVLPTRDWLSGQLAYFPCLPFSVFTLFPYGCVGGDAEFILGLQLSREACDKSSGVNKENYESFENLTEEWLVKKN